MGIRKPKKLPAEPKPKKEKVPKEPKKLTCQECPNFSFHKDIDYGADYYRESSVGKGTIAFILSPIDFYNLDKRQWKYSLYAGLMDYNVLFLPYPQCVENVLQPDKTKVAILRACKDNFILKYLKAYSIDLLVVFDDTKILMEVDDGKEIDFCGNWETWNDTQVYLAKGLYNPNTGGFWSENYQHTVRKIHKFFNKELIWQKNPDFKTVTTIEKLEEVIKKISEQDMVAVDVETSGLDVLAKDFRLKTIGLCWGKEAVCIGYEVEECLDLKYQSRVRGLIVSLLGNKDIVKVCHNLKFEMKVFIQKFSFHDFDNCEDTMFLSYLFDEKRESNGLKYLAGEYCDGYDKVVKEFADARLVDLWFYNCMDAFFTYYLRVVVFDLALLGTLKDGIKYVYENVMIPECYEIARMELDGVNVDFDYLEKLRDVLKDEVEELKIKIEHDYPDVKKARQEKEAAGKVQKTYISPKQLAHVLFEVLKYPTIKPTKGKNPTPSVDKEVLVTLKELHGCKLAEFLLELRKKEKQLSTYVIPYLEDRPNMFEGRVRSSYSQVKSYDAGEGQAKGTVTGRLCVAGSTLLYTDRGVFEIKDLIVSKQTKYYILTHTGRYQKIKNKFYKGEELMYRLTLDDGRYLDCTYHHQILTKEGWVYAGTRKKGNTVLSYLYDSGEDREYARNPRVDGRFISGDIHFTGLQSDRISEGLRVFGFNKSRCKRFAYYLFRQIRRAVKENKTFALFAGSDGKHTRNKRAAVNSNTERETGGFYCGGEDYMENCHRAWGERFYCEEQPYLSRPSEQHREQKEFDRIRNGIFEETISILSGYFGKCEKLLRRPGVVLQKAVSLFFGDVADSLVYSTAGSQHRVFEGAGTGETCEDSEERSVLVYKPLRSNAGDSTTGCEDFSLQTVHNLRDAHGRFLFSKSESLCGGGRCLPRNSREYEKERQGKGTHNSGEGLEAVTAFNGGSVEGCGGVRAAHKEATIVRIEKLKKQDVWDIEVEADHTYLAGGFVNHNSSAGPNLQNISRDKTIKKIFVPSAPKRVFIQSDLSQAELRIAASLAFEEKMLKVYKEDGDLHTRTGLLIVPKVLYDKFVTSVGNPTTIQRMLDIGKPNKDVGDKKLLGDIRQNGKPGNFGMIYGGTWAVLQRIAKQNYGLDLTKEDAMHAHAAFFAEYKNLEAWHNETHAFIAKYGMSVSPMGRVRRVPEVFVYPVDSEQYSAALREALNSIVQGMCLPSSEYVFTHKGYCQIGSLINKKFKVWDGENFSRARVVDRGESRIGRLKSYRCPELECDDRHDVKVFVGNDLIWKRVTDLELGDKVAVALPEVAAGGTGFYKKFYGNATGFGERGFDFVFSTSDLDTAYLLGYFVGDGCFGVVHGANTHWKGRWGTGRRLSYFTNFVFNCKDKSKSLKIIRRALKKACPSSYNHKLTLKRNRFGGKSCYSFSAQYHALYDMLIWLGFIPNCGAKNKRIAPKIFSMPLEFRKAFVNGLFDSDGTKSSYVCPAWHTSSPGLGKDIYLLLRSLGIMSNLYATKAGNFKVDVISTRAFGKVVGREFSSKETGEFGKTIMPRYCAAVFLDKIKGTCNNHLSYSEQVLISRVRHGGSVSLGKAIDILDKLFVDKTGLYIATEFEYFKMTKQVAKVYTLSVDDTKHQYDAAGYLSKNCADFLGQVWVRGMREVRKRKLDNVVRLSVHDSIVGDCLNKDVGLEVAHIMGDATKYWTEFHSQYWLQCPMKMDSSMGPHWGALKELDE